MQLVDLNQLRTFVVLYELRSLTATAHRLHVTQPTVSYTVRRLREQFGDDLFRREGHAMVPTARATTLFGPLQDALVKIENALSDPGDFDPMTFTGEFSLGLTSIGEQTFLPPIMEALAGASPGIQLKVERLDSDEVQDGLSRGTIDLAITVMLMADPLLWRTTVRDVEYVALCAGKHALPPVGPEMFEGRRFVRVSARGGHVFPLQALVEHGLMDQVALTVEGYATVPAVLEATDLVVFLPRHVAEVFRGWFPGLTITDLPWPGASNPVALYTRREASLSPAQRWFRSLVFDAVASEAYRTEGPEQG
ncbi:MULTISPECIES: LysR family transcriptional regulator [Arthrobacter]|uniref:LysR family transcriptional regulator n=2 Tax=Arthrobacter TaxID=1663 RepID=A0ABU9KLZ7_9MICC|nr:LysR family transcriptional regulator [Arthrobacter sp. YJM1]MDP5228148.1 LysR family transcriptional regulator [Arthrobacter sp. YJM1]